MEYNIKVSIVPEEMTPEAYEEHFDYAKGFAKSVRGSMDIAGDWGWCVVTVRIFDGDEMVGEDHLGGCSYLGLEDFIVNSGYFNSMVSNCLSGDIHNKHRSIFHRVWSN